MQVHWFYLSVLTALCFTTDATCRAGPDEEETAPRRHTSASCTTADAADEARRGILAPSREPAAHRLDTVTPGVCAIDGSPGREQSAPPAGAAPIEPPEAAVEPAASPRPESRDWSMLVLAGIAAIVIAGRRLRTS